KAVGFEDDVLIDIIQTSITEGNSDLLSKADRHFDLPTMIKQVEGFLGTNTSSLTTLITKYLKDVETGFYSTPQITNGSNNNDHNNNNNSFPPPSERTTLHVGNIPYIWDVPNLLSSLSSLTSCSLISAHIPPSGVPGSNRGFAFVEVSFRDVIRFRGDVSGEEVEGGRRLKVSEAAARPVQRG
ncbi:hypothetical protein TrRE_jg3705, partial [Triparma retinervis]